MSDEELEDLVSLKQSVHYPNSLIDDAYKELTTSLDMTHKESIDTIKLCAHHDAIAGQSGIALRDVLTVLRLDKKENRRISDGEIDLITLKVHPSVNQNGVPKNRSERRAAKRRKH